MIRGEFECPKCKGKGVSGEGCFTPVFDEGKYVCKDCGYKFRVREYNSYYKDGAPVIKVLSDKWILSFDKGSFWGSFGYTLAFMYMVMGIVLGGIGLYKGLYILSGLSFAMAIMNFITLRKFS